MCVVLGFFLFQNLLLEVHVSHTTGAFLPAAQTKQNVTMTSVAMRATVVRLETTVALGWPLFIAVSSDQCRRG